MTIPVASRSKFHLSHDERVSIKQHQPAIQVHTFALHQKIDFAARAFQETEYSAACYSGFSASIGMMPACRMETCAVVRRKYIFSHCFSGFFFVPFYRTLLVCSCGKHYETMRSKYNLETSAKSWNVVITNYVTYFRPSTTVCDCIGMDWAFPNSQNVQSDLVIMILLNNGILSIMTFWGKLMILWFCIMTPPYFDLFAMHLDTSL